jgi:hypothetical protein
MTNKANTLASMRLLGLRFAIMVLRPLLYLVASITWRLDEVYYRMNELCNRLNKKVEQHKANKALDRIAQFDQENGFL